MRNIVVILGVAKESSAAASVPSLPSSIVLIRIPSICSHTIVVHRLQVRGLGYVLKCAGQRVIKADVPLQRKTQRKMNKCSIRKLYIRLIICGEHEIKTKQ